MFESIKKDRYFNIDSFIMRNLNLNKLHPLKKNQEIWKQKEN